MSLDNASDKEALWEAYGEAEVEGGVGVIDVGGLTVVDGGDELGLGVEVGGVDVGLGVDVGGRTDELGGDGGDIVVTTVLVVVVVALAVYVVVVVAVPPFKMLLQNINASDVWPTNASNPHFSTATC